MKNLRRYWTTKAVAEILHISERAVWWHLCMFKITDKSRHKLRLTKRQMQTVVRRYTKFKFRGVKLSWAQPKIMQGLGYLLLVFILAGCSPYFNQSKVVDPGKGKPITR